MTLTTISWPNVGTEFESDLIEEGIMTFRVPWWFSFLKLFIRK